MVLDTVFQDACKRLCFGSFFCLGILIVSIFCFDLVSKEMIENSFNVKKEIKGNIELKLFRTESPCQS